MISLFTIIGSHGDKEVRRIPLNKKIQNGLSDVFETQHRNFCDKIDDYIVFEGGYLADSDTAFRIQDFDLGTAVNRSLTSAQSVPIFNYISDARDIKSIYALCYNNRGDVEHVLFQSFTSSRIIDNGKTLFFSGRTYHQFNDFAMTIGNSLSALYDCEEKALIFRSFEAVRKYLDMEEIFHEASEADIQTLFEENPIIACPDIGDFIRQCTYRMRKQVTLIKNSGILQTVSTAHVTQACNELYPDFTLDANQDRIVFPDDKAGIQKILNLLAEEVFKGPLSGTIFSTNSKRRIQR